ncbi:protein-L-isoaspartate O-methyltransferase family protein [Jeongeupia naejangsanensis]|uniref:Protein-L-isoaspartate O-methyltransferase n=1 Tax=Jeongeupia naejangsanensis TaxID=613195 RepID=A0ABS2BPB2_9NEIS|nr:protein-L-isoaspartate O-methyltransferase [Jeongeupia naejangsanensis]MBM3117403.1 protein-L-isoaspartate O-methyltransferase [Jeongeupia naejangsanensis]
MDWERARYFLVEQQIRPWHVLDQKVLDRVLAVKREDFVPQDKRALAFVDTELPLPCGGQMLAPKIEARFAQEALLKPTDKVLVIGAASGAYLIGLIAGLCEQVYGIDDTAEKVAFAQAGVQRAGIKNVRVEQVDELLSYIGQAPFDGVIITASLDDVPVKIRDVLSPGGRLVAVIGKPPVMNAERISRGEQGAYHEVALFEYSLPRLMQKKEKATFDF